MQRRLYRNKSKTDSTKTQISLAKKSQLSIDKEKEDLEFEKKIVITQRNLAAKKINGKLMVVDVFDSDDEKEGKKKAVLSSSSPPEKSVMYEGSINRWAPKAKGDIIPTAITKTMVISKTGVTHKVDDESNFTTENETFKCCEEGCKDEKFDTLEEAKTHYSTKHLDSNEIRCPCVTCDQKNFDSIESLFAHFKKEHTMYVCELCRIQKAEKIFRDWKKIRVSLHQKKFHPFPKINGEKNNNNNNNNNKITIRKKILRKRKNRESLQNEEDGDNEENENEEKNDVDYDDTEDSDFSKEKKHKKQKKEEEKEEIKKNDTQSLFRDTIITKYGKKAFTCKECVNSEQIYKSAYAFNVHFLQYHPNAKGLHRCKICNEGFTYLDSLTRHKRKMHSQRISPVTKLKNNLGENNNNFSRDDITDDAGENFISTTKDSSTGKDKQISIISNNDEKNNAGEKLKKTKKVSFDNSNNNNNDNDNDNNNKIKPITFEDLYGYDNDDENNGGSDDINIQIHDNNVENNNNDNNVDEQKTKEQIDNHPMVEEYVNSENLDQEFVTHDDGEMRLDEENVTIPNKKDTDTFQQKHSSLQIRKQKKSGRARKSSHPSQWAAEIAAAPLAEPLLTPRNETLSLHFPQHRNINQLHIPFTNQKPVLKHRKSTAHSVSPLDQMGEWEKMEKMQQRRQYFKDNANKHPIHMETFKKMTNAL